MSDIQMATAQERAELRKLAEDATQGEWTIDRRKRSIIAIGPCTADEYAGCAWLEVSEADALYLKASAENLPKLLDDIDLLTAERDSYEADAKLWRWWRDNRAVEREYGYDCEDVPVTLYRVEGSVNDREWVKIAEGNTLDEAVRAAMKGDQP